MNAYPVFYYNGFVCRDMRGVRAEQGVSSPV